VKLAIRTAPVFIEAQAWLSDIQSGQDVRAPGTVPGSGRPKNLLHFVFALIADAAKSIPAGVVL
jgi:hypothetical protein